MHATDPDILLALAKAQSAQGKAGDTIATLDTLKSANPGYRSPDGHLLYARSLEGLDRDSEALAEYDVLEDSFPGEEARVRKAELLRRLGRDADARAVLEKVIERVRIAPDFYRKAQREWVDRAKQMLSVAECGARRSAIARERLQPRSPGACGKHAGAASRAASRGTLKIGQAGTT
jgi:hypothetical protein